MCEQVIYIVLQVVVLVREYLQEDVESRERGDGQE